MVSVIIPAHNEAGVIGRLLGQLACSAGADDMDVIVVVNGCTDDTAEVVAAFSPPVRVVTLPVASKREALDAGDHFARGFPRIYVDADIELGIEDIRALDAALRRPGVLAAAPERVLVLADRPWLVRWYYDVWARLPEVRSGLFGRGVVGVSELGHERLASLPPVIGDDLAASLMFRPGRAHCRARRQSGYLPAAYRRRPPAPPRPRVDRRDTDREDCGSSGHERPDEPLQPGRHRPRRPADGTAGGGLLGGGSVRTPPRQAGHAAERLLNLAAR